MRALFNARNFAALVAQGVVADELFEPDHFAPPDANQDAGTRSQLRCYVDQSGLVVALFHQYTRPDGSVGGRGRPDPKWLDHNGVALIPMPDPRRQCAWCKAQRPVRPQPGTAGGHQPRRRRRK